LRVFWKAGRKNLLTFASFNIGEYDVQASSDIREGTTATDFLKMVQKALDTQVRVRDKSIILDLDIRPQRSTACPII